MTPLDSEPAPEELHLLNLTLRFIYPGAEYHPLDRPFPDGHSRQLMLTAIRLALAPESFSELECLSLEAKQQWQAALSSRIAESASRQHYNLTGEAADRKARTASLLADLGLT